MAIKDFKELSLSELNKKLADLKDELFHLRFQLAINQLENPMRIKAVKKDIARVQTLLTENKLKEQNNVNAASKA